MLQSLLGLILLPLLCWWIGRALGSTAPVPWRIVLAAMACQLVLAALLLGVPGLDRFFLLLNDGVLALQQASLAGTSLVFGYLGGGPLPFEETAPGASFILAFQALPLVLLISVLSALLYQWGVLPWVVRIFAQLLQRLLGIGGVAGTALAANVFLGMVESPLLVRPYLAQLKRSELFLIMCAGLSTVAGTVLVLYATFLVDVLETPISHLLIASLISAPASVAVAALLVPGSYDSAGHAQGAPYRSSADALVNGTQQGTQLLLAIVSTLVVIVALVALCNQILGVLPYVAGEALTLERLVGWAMWPLAWLIGIPSGELHSAGELLGIKTVLNEFLAFQQLGQNEVLSERSVLLMSYALCGFTNPVSLGILIGGLSAMLPERRSEIAELGPLALLGGVFSTALTACVVGVLSS